MKGPVQRLNEMIRELNQFSPTGTFSLEMYEAGLLLRCEPVRPPWEDRLFLDIREKSYSPEEWAQVSKAQKIDYGQDVLASYESTAPRIRESLGFRRVRRGAPLCHVVYCTPVHDRQYIWRVEIS